MWLPQDHKCSYNMYHIPMKSASLTNEKCVTQLLVHIFLSYCVVSHTLNHPNLSHVPLSLWQRVHMAVRLCKLLCKTYTLQPKPHYRDKSWAHIDLYTSADLRLRPTSTHCACTIMCFILRHSATNASLYCGHSMLRTLKSLTLKSLCACPEIDCVVMEEAKQKWWFSEVLIRCVISWNSSTIAENKPA